MDLRHAIAVFATAISCFGCGGNSKEPIATEESSITDARIEGEWAEFSREKGCYERHSPQTQIRVRTADKKVYECEYKKVDPGGETLELISRFRLVTLGPYTYVDVFELHAAGESERDLDTSGLFNIDQHMVFAVHIQDDRICFGNLDREHIRALEKTGVILPAHEDPSFGTFKFIAPTEELQGFLSKHGPEIVTGDQVEWRRPAPTTK